ncbi:9982_t:CDS:2 [Funneliformis mosseae]|uniref:9982_t:CDS:1 n=1 Tax=Funneliformis mosseae TaxID=27381 RepID=A0A9N9D1F7_FUNMO|nr:9982_t:CDS:2 [Funneliformis mosseae]
MSSSFDFDQSKRPIATFTTNKYSAIRRFECSNRTTISPDVGPPATYNPRAIYTSRPLNSLIKRSDIETASLNSVIDPNSPGFTTKLIKSPALGLLNNKYRLHVITKNNSNSNPNLFSHRICYNTGNNAYYENGIFDKKYLKSWRKGCLEYDNIAYKVELDRRMVYLAREPDIERLTESGYIIWQFDYRSGNFIITSLNLRLQHCIFDESASVIWSISPLPTRTNPNPTFHLITPDLLTCNTPNDEYECQRDNTLKNASSLIKGEYGFKLKVELIGGGMTDMAWQKAQLFRQKRIAGNDALVDDDETFGFDVKVELTPDIVCDPLPEIIQEDGKEIIFNDKETSDFIISLETESKDYYVHTAVLSSRSDYFKALLDSNMIESNNRSLILKEISSITLDTLLKFMYTGEITFELDSIEDWIDLMYGASRFQIPTLIQRCEKALKELVDEENVEDIEAIARDCGAEQLIRYFDMLLDVDDETTNSSDEDKNKLNIGKKKANKSTNIGVASLRNIFRRKNKKIH